jgi:hypothetical protein
LVDRLDIDGIGPTLVASLLIGLFSSILQYFVFRHEDAQRNR